VTKIFRAASLATPSYDVHGVAVGDLQVVGVRVLEDVVIAVNDFRVAGVGVLEDVVMEGHGLLLAKLRGFVSIDASK
jgi:hypothetical protein